MKSGFSRLVLLACASLVLTGVLVSNSAIFGLNDDAPPVPPPVGSISTVRDNCANYWTLTPAEGRQKRLLVLPAQAPNEWVAPGVEGVTPGEWEAVRADEAGYVWLQGAGRLLRLDPRKPEQGAVEASPPAIKAQQGHWREVARMPASNHDLTAAVLGGKFYVSGGLTGDWGFPARSHPFDELWELDAKTWKWRVAAKLSRPRIYTATAAFAGKIWVIGGDVIEANGQRRAVTLVELYDPRTGRVTAGPEPQAARPMPVALAANGRLYVIGNPRDEYEQPGRIESIGPGEQVWRREPDGPQGMGPLAATALGGALYVLVPKKGLAVFDTKSRQWELIPGPMQPRSCQMAAYRGEIWMMGGRDIQDLAQTLIFNPRTRAWRSGPPLPKPLSWGAAEVVGGRLIVAGGAAERSREDRTWIYSDRTYVLND
jgi:serine/threonine-protein kinase PknK